MGPDATVRHFKLTSRLLALDWIILPACILLCYMNGIEGEFVFDDIPLLQNDPFYGEGRMLDCWKRDFWSSGFSQGLYRPFATFTYWLNMRLSGAWPPAFRIFNLLIHSLAVLMLYKLALRFRAGRAASLLAAAIFAVHPLHTEAVTPAFGRAELLCAFFVFAGLLLHTYSYRSRAAALGVMLCAVFGFWSKEHGIILIPLCIAYDCYAGFLAPHAVLLRPLAWRYAFYCAAFAAAAWARIAYSGSFLPSLEHFDPMGDNPLALCSPGIRIVSALKLQGLALWKQLWPSVLSHDYSYKQLMPAESAFDISAWLAVLAMLAGAAILLAAAGRKKKLVLLMTVFYVVSVLPASNIITPTGTIFGERLFYLPSAWSILAASLVLVQLARRMNALIGIGLCLLILAACTARTIVRNEDWATQMNICIAGTRTAPFSTKTWNNIAVELANHGEMEAAVEACRKSLEIYPESKRTLKNRAFYLIKLGRMDEARADLEKLVSLDSRDTEVYNKLGAILANGDRLGDAKKMWLRSLELNPSQPMIKKSLGILEDDIRKRQDK